jgi:steroid 5-alpha reductase family enzyme
MEDQTRNSILGIAAAVIIGALVAWAGSDGSAAVSGVPVFALCGLAAYVINWAAFVPANAAKTERFYDLTGSVTYISVILLAVLLSPDPDARAIIVVVMVAVWAARLGSFLYRRIRRDGKDGRFDQIKQSSVRFLMTWTLQGLWVLLTAAAALAIITSDERQTLDWVAFVGIAVWAAGFAIEVVSDRQKSAFKKDRANEGRYIDTGLWAWSRHPNYFGEITLWTGIAIMAVPILSGWRWVVLISPVFVFLLISRVSGVPMLESRADKRWGDEPGYQEYKKNTPVLVPRPPRPRSEKSTRRP